MNATRREHSEVMYRVIHEIRFALPTALIFIVVLALVTNGFTGHFWKGAILAIGWIPLVSFLSRCYLLLIMICFRWWPRRLPPFEPIAAGIPIGPRKPAPLTAHARISHRGD